MSLFSFCEEIAEIYYSKNNFFTTRNHSYLDKKTSGNRDIDLIAFNGKKLLIISCKRGSLNQSDEKKEVVLFKQAAKELKKIFPNIKVKPNYVFIAEWIKESNLKFFKKNKIQCIKLNKIVKDLLDILDKEMGTKKLDGRESYVSSRLLKFLIKNKLINLP